MARQQALAARVNADKLAAAYKAAGSANTRRSGRNGTLDKLKTQMETALQAAQEAEELADAMAALSEQEEEDGDNVGNEVHQKRKHSNGANDDEHEDEVNEDSDDDAYVEDENDEDDDDEAGAVDDDSEEEDEDVNDDSDEEAEDDDDWKSNSRKGRTKKNSSSTTRSRKARATSADHVGAGGTAARGSSEAPLVLVAVQPTADTESASTATTTQNAEGESANLSDTARSGEAVDATESVTSTEENDADDRLSEQLHLKPDSRASAQMRRELRNNRMRVAMRWPSVFYLHTDNTTKENKTYSVLFFLALLVLFGHFDKVKWNLPQVGHSHDYIDQIFSCISRLLRKACAFTVSHLHSVMERAWSKFTGQTVRRAVCVVLDEVYAVKQWIERFAPKGSLTGITFPYIFKLTRTTVTERRKVGNEEVDVTDEVVLLHARHTLVSRSIDVMKERLNDTESDKEKYDAPIVLLRRSEVDDAMKERANPVVQGRVMMEPTFEKLRTTIRHVFSTHHGDGSDPDDMTPQHMAEWEALISRARSLDVLASSLISETGSVSCDECKRFEKLLTIQSNQLIQFTGRGTVVQKELNAKVRKEMSKIQAAKNEHMQKKVHGQESGWWTSRGLPQANELLVPGAEDAFDSDPEEEDEVYETGRTKGGLAVYKGHLSLVSFRKGGRRVNTASAEGQITDKMTIEVNDIVIVNAPHKGESEFVGTYPFFWLAQVVAISTNVTDTCAHTHTHTRTTHTHSQLHPHTSVLTYVKCCNACRSGVLYRRAMFRQAPESRAVGEKMESCTCTSRRQRTWCRYDDMQSIELTCVCVCESVSACACVCALCKCSTLSDIVLVSIIRRAGRRRSLMMIGWPGRTASSGGGAWRTTQRM